MDASESLHVAVLMGVEGFGGRLGDARRAKGQRLRRDYKAAELARDAGVTSATVSRWENGEVVPDAELIAKLAKILDVSPGWLAFGETALRVAEEPVVRPAEAQTVPRREKRRQRGA